MPELTTVLATYGAVVATLAVAWNVWRDLTDQGRLRVHCFIGFMALPGVSADQTDGLFFGVTNVGRRPILVAKVGGWAHAKYFIVSPQPWHDAPDAGPWRVPARVAGRSAVRFGQDHEVPGRVGFNRQTVEG